MELARELSDKNKLKDDDQALDFDRLLVVEFVIPERESEGEKAERKREEMVHSEGEKEFRLSTGFLWWVL